MIAIHNKAEVLTTNGWVRADELPEKFDAGVSDDKDVIRWTQATRIKPHFDCTGEMVRYKSLFRDVVEEKHHTPVMNIGDEPKPKNVPLAVMLPGDYGTRQSDYLIQLAIWVLAKAVIKTNEDGTVDHLLFSRMRTAYRRRLKGVVTSAPGLKWEEDGDTMRVRGANLALYMEAITGIEFHNDGARWINLPDWFMDLPATQGIVAAKELAYCARRATFALRTTYFDGWRHDIGEKLQKFLFLRGIPSKMVYLNSGQYTLVFNETGNLEFGRGTNYEVGDVFPAKTVISCKGSLIVRSYGTISVVGVR